MNQLAKPGFVAAGPGLPQFFLPLQPPPRREPAAGLIDPAIPQEIGQVCPHPPRQGVVGLMAIALGDDDGFGDLRGAERLAFGPAQRVGNQPVQFAAAEQLDPPQSLWSRFNQQRGGGVTVEDVLVFAIAV